MMERTVSFESAFGETLEVYLGLLESNKTQELLKFLVNENGHWRYDRSHREEYLQRFAEGKHISHITILENYRRALEKP